jgi:hypothetical protein
MFDIVGNDPALDEDDLKLIETLTPKDISVIDETILNNCNQRWRKVAMVVIKSMSNLENEYYEIPSTHYASRVKDLVSLGKLESQGNLSRMRFSEIRLPAIKPEKI